MSTYVTVPVARKKDYQLTFEDILNGVNADIFVPKKDTFDTKTWLYKTIPSKLVDKVYIPEMISELQRFNVKYKELIDIENKATLYDSFKIPKRSGGLRPIDAPKEPLMMALRELKYIFEMKLYASHHTTAFAYVKGRSTIDAVKRHQHNNSRWFLKLDAHNFFGSTTPQFVIKMLEMIFPFSEILKREDGRIALVTALSLCFLNGGLPQGTPISPTLTNVMMIPVDHTIAKAMRENTPHLCYTRYADDMLISSDLSFCWSEVQRQVVDIFKQFEAPFNLNQEKTRYGSSAGRNWNLGVMLNKDNQITIGHQKKKQFKAMLFSLMNDHQNGIAWSLSDIQALNGNISYYKMVEKESIEAIIDTYSQKFNYPVMQVILDVLRA